MRKQELYIFFIKIYFMSDIFANGILKKKITFITVYVRTYVYVVTVCKM